MPFVFQALRRLFPLALLALLPFSVQAEVSVTQYFRELQSLDAGFRQVVLDANGRVAQRSAGHMAMAKPARFRWDYTEPSPQTIVADGKRLWVYDPGLEQVTVKPLDNALGSTPLALLSGVAPIDQAFSVGKVQRIQGLDWYTLTPKSSDSDFQSLRIGFGDGELAAIELLDKLGGRTRLDFIGLKHNPALDAAEFVFTPPAGVDVIGDRS